MFLLGETQFVLQKSTNPQSKYFGVLEICMHLWVIVVVWIKNSCTIFFEEIQRVNTFARGTEKRNILGNLMDKKLEQLADHGCPKNRGSS